MCNELPKSRSCPLCVAPGGTNKQAELQAVDEVIHHDGTAYTIVTYFYKSNCCGIEFYTPESDLETLKQHPGYPNVQPIRLNRK